MIFTSPPLFIRFSFRLPNLYQHHSESWMKVKQGENFSFPHISSPDILWGISWFSTLFLPHLMWRGPWKFYFHMWGRISIMIMKWGEKKDEDEERFFSMCITMILMVICLSPFWRDMREREKLYHHGMDEWMEWSQFEPQNVSRRERDTFGELNSIRELHVPHSPDSSWGLKKVVFSSLPLNDFISLFSVVSSFPSVIWEDESGMWGGGKMRRTFEKSCC